MTPYVSPPIVGLYVTVIENLHIILARLTHTQEMLYELHFVAI
jgi:hypothetical protein